MNMLIFPSTIYIPKNPMKHVNVPIPTNPHGGFSHPHLGEKPWKDRDRLFSNMFDPAGDTSGLNAWHSRGNGHGNGPVVGFRVGDSYCEIGCEINESPVDKYW